MNSDNRHHDTTDLPPEDLKLAELRAVKLEAHIQQFFESYWHQDVAPHKVKEFIDKKLGLEYPNDTLLTSVRRGISNLTRDGILEKLPEKVKGSHGSPVHVWRLKPKDSLFDTLPIKDRRVESFGGL